MKLTRISVKDDDYCWVDLSRIEWIEWRSDMGINVYISGVCHDIPESHADEIMKLLDENK